MNRGGTWPSRGTLASTVPGAVTTLITLVWAPLAGAETALVAVAANFHKTAQVLERRFENDSGHDLTITTGSTGKLYAQIVSGAPFDVLLAADRERPALLERSVRGVVGSRFTYAVGVLTLWSPDPDAVTRDVAAALSRPDLRKLAIANPALAPYGAAAKETLHSLGLWQGLQSRIVTGENVGQVHALVATRNADLGFLALSQVLGSSDEHRGSRWDAPADLHTPIRQDAVLLSHGRDNPAALAFLTYLKSDVARELIEAHGYRVD